MHCPQNPCVHIIAQEYDNADVNLRWTEIDKTTQNIACFQKATRHHVATTRPINQPPRCHHAAPMTRPCKTSRFSIERLYMVYKPILR